MVCAQASSSTNSVSGAPRPAISSSSNPLLPNALFPQWAKISAANVGPAIKQVLEEEGAALDLLEADLQAAGKDVTYERVYRPYSQIRYRLDNTFGLIDNLQVSAQQQEEGRRTACLSSWWTCNAARMAVMRRPTRDQPGQPVSITFGVRSS